MSEGWNIAILGATGAVGEALLETLAERQFPVGDIYALARTDSAGEHLRFNGKSVMVQDAAAFDWTQAQLAFFAAGAEATASYIEEATNSGCLVIDLSGLFAMEPDGIPIDEDDFFGRQLAFNMLPLLPDREGSVREERRIVDEARKILQDEGLMISANVVQSPVFYGHAQMVGFEALRPLAAEEARDAFGRGEDIVLSEESEFPTQVGDATGSAHLSVGCVRNDYGMPEQVQFWSVADNVRFGGALMAVKIAEKLVQEYLY